MRKALIVGASRSSGSRALGHEGIADVICLMGLYTSVASQQRTVPGVGRRWSHDRTASMLLDLWLN